MKSWTVYKHTSPSGKVYVGISSDINRRWAANGYYYCLADTIFSKALRKYGWDNFQHIIVQEGLTKKEACDMEKELIAYYKAKKLSYNITDGGEGYCGKHSGEHVQHRVEARLANSTIDYLVIDKAFNYIVCDTEREAAEYLGGVQSNISHVLKQPIGYTFRKHYIWKHEKGAPVDIESIKQQIQAALQIRKQKMSEAGKIANKLGVKARIEAVKNMSPAERKLKFGHGDKRKGKHHSEETKQKISAAAKGRDMSKAIAARKLRPHTPTNVKPIVQYTPTGEYVNEYLSITQASVETGIIKTGISNCLVGRSITSGGYKWQYKN